MPCGISHFGPDIYLRNKREMFLLLNIISSGCILNKVINKEYLLLSKKYF